MKIFAAFLLAAVLAVTPLSVHAEGEPGQEEVLFPAVQEYPDFRDVKEGEWYYEPIVICSTSNIMVGVEPTVFSPFGLMIRATIAAASARLKVRLGEKVP